MIFYIFLITLALSVDCCPTGGDTTWVELGDSCYSISREPMDWGTAQEVGLNFRFMFNFENDFQFCWEQGGYLAEIMSAQEEILLDTFLVEGITYWLGLSDFAHEGNNLITL